ncbi:MAG: cytochrome C, partial [Rhodobacteraceae bacterium]
PPKEEVIEAGSLDMAGMIAYGERLFSGKGTCTLCHNDLGRAPDLLNLDLAATFKARLGDPAYDGGPEVGDYLHQSFVDPSAYVVAGFGKKGSNDTVSPMPVVSAPPIEMNDVQLNALSAFLQDRAGLEPNVPLPSAADAPAEDPVVAEDAGEPLATTGTDAVEKFYCSSCHDLNGSEADVGPNLNDLATRMTRGEVMVAILDPNAVIADGYEADYMPGDFGDQMQASELLLIVDYLMDLGT